MKKKNIGGQGKLGKPIKIGTLSVGLNLSQPQEEWEATYKKWFDKTMEDCAMYEFPNNGVKGLLQGKTGKFAGFIFLEESIKLFISNLISEIREEEYQRRRKEKGMTAKAGDEMCEIRLRKREAEIRKEERELVIDEIRRKVPKMCVVCEPKFTKITAKMYRRTN